MDWVYHDGGRIKAGFRGRTGDCVVRAISIAAELPYGVVYNEINELIARQRKNNKALSSSSRSGVPKIVYNEYLLTWLGATWTPTMFIGQGCQVHLSPDEIPKKGRHILRLSHHLTAVIDGVVYDTHDPSRNGTRCVYGMYRIDDGTLH